MRLTTFILIATIMQVSASSFAQKISLSEKNTPLAKVFKKITQKSGYGFFVNGKILEDTKPVTIDIKDGEIKDVLALIFKDQPVSFTIEEKLVVVSRKQQPLLQKMKTVLQIPVTVSGRVTDTTGTPLVGASIVKKSDGRVLSTNDKGEFTLTAQSGDQITISFIGYQLYSFTITNNLPYQDIVLHVSSSKLSEVMVSTGYQTLSKERATGSFYKIDNKLFNQNVSTDVISRLEGISSGMLFDKRNPNETKIQIRGLSTLVSESQPLIILDNFPYEGDINNINPNDVENVTILKDASAASIWGARAGNGVIVITTKKGKFNQATAISFNVNTSFSQKPDLSKLPLIPSTDYIDLERFLFEKGLYTDKISYPEYYPLTPVVEILADKDLTEAQANQKINALRNLDVRDDFKKYIYRTGINQQYALNINGGTDKVRYYLSTGIDKNQTNLIGNDYSRISVKSSNTFKPFKGLQIQTDLLYTKSNIANNSPGAYATNYNIGSSSIYPYARLADQNGTPLALDNQTSKRFTDTVGNGKLLDWKYYPLKELAESDNRSVQNDILANLGLVYELSPAISAEVKYQYERTFSDTRNYRNLNTFYTRDLINRYTNLNGTTAELKNPVPIGGIMDLTNGDLIGNSVRGQVNLNKRWSDNNEVNAVAGVEVRETNTKQATSRTYGYDPQYLSFKNVDYVNDYQTYNGINGNTTIPNNNRFSDLRYRYVSTYANIAYTYHSRYTISASARKDASNIFGVDANDKGTPLWSTGLAWDISKEKFWSIAAIPYLKMRSTYGYSGNTNQSVSALTVLQYYPASLSIVNLPFADILNAPNPNLRWEKVNMFNTGIDFALKGNRLSGSLEYYTKISTDLLAYQNLDATTGLGYAITNSGTMKGNGIDVVLNGTLIDKKLKWLSTFLFSHSTYKVTKAYNSSKTNGYTSSGYALIALEGYSPYEVVSNKWAGLDPKTGDPQGYINGAISKDYTLLRSKPFEEQIKHGSALPLYFGNFRNTFAYGKFSVALNVAYSFDYYFFKPTVNYTDLLNNGTVNSDYLYRWQNPGDEATTNIPSFVYPANSARDAFYQFSEINVLKGDNIRLKDIYFDYSVGNTLLRRLSISSLRLYANIANLDIILWKANKANIDPNNPTGLKLGKVASIGIKIDL